MSTYTCFAQDVERDLLDRQAFTLKHKLMGHPALTIENLGHVLPALPKGQVVYSSGLLSESDNFDRAHIEHANGLSLEQTLETIRTSNSYIMVRAPERHASFAPLFKDLRADVETLIQARGVGRHATDPMLYLFIASPASVTPFHIDRYSTILMQFQGTKVVEVFPQWDDRVVTPSTREGFMARADGVRPEWRPEVQALGRAFQFSPGDALHLPFMAGHCVRNGSDDVSISMSIIFNTEETMRLSRAMLFNHQLRRRLKFLGVEPNPVGTHSWRDGLKAGLWATGAQVVRTLKRSPRPSA